MDTYDFLDKLTEPKTESKYLYKENEIKNHEVKSRIATLEEDLKTLKKDQTEIESLKAELNELKDILHKETEDEKRYRKFIEEAAPERYTSMRISITAKEDILSEKVNDESLEKIIKRVFGEVRDYRQVLGEIVDALESEESDEKKVEDIKKSLGM